MPLPEDLREARALNRVEFERTMNRYLYMTPDEISEVVGGRQAPLLDLMCASIASKAVEEGCHQRMEFILTRMIGRAPERIEEVEDEEYVRPESMRSDP